MITAPVKGIPPVKIISLQEEYAGTIVWKTDADEAVGTTFAADTVYKAVVTLNANSGYTFAGFPANSVVCFDLGSATLDGNKVNSGNVTITFPKTAAEDDDSTVTQLNLTSLITKPVVGVASSTLGNTDERQYTGSVEWKTDADGIVVGNFAAGTVYKAVVTLTAKDDYTFTGILANKFTYTGATVTNLAGSDPGTTIVVTITFPATATLVSALSLNDLVTAPVRDASPDTTVINKEQYTGTIAWKTEDDDPVNSKFAADTVYKAVVTLAPKIGFTFIGLPANSFTHSSATPPVTNEEDTGIVTITFPITAAENEDSVVNALSLTSLITKPAAGATPQTAPINHTQYTTGPIAWKIGDESFTGTAFEAGKVYKAIVTLTARAGFTFDSLTTVSFSHDGATSVAYEEDTDTDSGTVTITFPATPTVVTNRNLTDFVTKPAKGESPVTTFAEQTEYTGAIVWQNTTGINISGNFAAGTVYKAVVTLTATGAYTFTGLGSSSFTYALSGATVTSEENTGATITVTITFPTTAADPKVTDLALTTLVKQPVKGESPVTTFTEQTQYTGTIDWKTNAGADFVGTPFAADTVYKALVTLTAKANYTFTGVGEDSFTYALADASVANSAGSGPTIAVTITFPKTAADSKTLIIAGIPPVPAGQSYYYLVAVLNAENNPVAGIPSGQITGNSISETLKILTVSGAKDNPDFTFSGNWSESGSYYLSIFVASAPLVSGHLYDNIIYQAYNPNPINFTSDTVTANADEFQSFDDKEIHISGVPDTYQDYDAYIYLFNNIPGAGLYNGDVIRAHGDHEDDDLYGHLQYSGSLDDSYYVVVNFVKGYSDDIQAAIFKTNTKVPIGDQILWSNFARINNGTGNVTLGGTAEFNLNAAPFTGNLSLGANTFPNGEGRGLHSVSITGGVWTDYSVSKDIFLVSFRIGPEIGGTSINMGKTVILNGQNPGNISLGTTNAISLNGTIGDITLKGSPFTPGTNQSISIEARSDNSYLGYASLWNNGDDPNGWKTWTLYVAAQLSPKPVTFDIYLYTSDDKTYRRKNVPVTPSVSAGANAVTDISIGDLIFTEEHLRNN